MASAGLARKKHLTKEMKRLFWFCPENDIALGRGCVRFTPPRQAALLARYGAPLMWWMGGADDCVLIPAMEDSAYRSAFSRWHDEMTCRFGCGPCFVDSLEGVDIKRLEPWGWSAYTAGRLLDAGASSGLTAFAVSRMEDVRRLSHRRTAGLVNMSLARIVDFPHYSQPLPVPAVEVSAVDDVLRFAAGHGAFYVKSPWSSSGRGVVRGDRLSAGRLEERCAGIIRSQGSVMLEPAHDKIADFAMLFNVDGGGAGVRFYGFSRFFNAHDAAYGGNVIASDDEIFAWLARLVGAELLSDVRDALCSILAGIVGDAYRGLLGVDMMVAQGEGGLYIVPCVELNLRMTMGHVAHAIYERTGMSGVMKIAPAACSGGAILELVPENGYFNAGLFDGQALTCVNH